MACFTAFVLLFLFISLVFWDIYLLMVFDYSYTYIFLEGVVEGWSDGNGFPFCFAAPYFLANDTKSLMIRRTNEKKYFSATFEFFFTIARCSTK